MSITDDSCIGTQDWPHAPPHRLASAGVYFVTARTRLKFPHFNTSDRLTFVRDSLLAKATHYGWRLEAWAVLANHYHFVGHSPAERSSANSLVKMVRHLHGDISRHLNQIDNTPGRMCWQNYRETHLTFPESYLARLNYTHNNPVHHRLVEVATHYEWCSAGDFERNCQPAWVKTISSFKFDDIATEDDDE